MTQAQNLRIQPIQTATLVKQILIGAGIGLIPMSIFLLGVNDPNPAWGNTWIIKPLLMVPLAGATGGAFYYFMNQLRNQYNWSKIWVNILCFIVYIIGLFMGAV